MPEPQHSTEVLVGMLFRDVPEAGQRFRENRIYRALQHSMAGIHDLTSLMLIAAALEDRAYRYVVVDTAPSRYGLDFLTYPGRLAQLFEGRAIGFLGTLSGRSRRRESEFPPPIGERPPEARGFFAWGKKRLESALSKVLDPDTFYDLTNLFFELAAIRRRFSTLARSAERLLLGNHTQFLTVATPSFGSEADARFIARRLASIHPRSEALGPRAFLLNRSDVGLPDWFQRLDTHHDVSEPMRHTLRDLRGELDARRRAADSIEQRLAADFPHTQIVRLPTIEERDPAAIVQALSNCLAPQLETLLPDNPAQRL